MAASATNGAGPCDECGKGAVGDFKVRIGASRVKRLTLCGGCRHDMAGLAPVTDVQPIFGGRRGGER